MEVKAPAAEQTVHVIDEKAEVNFETANFANLKILLTIMYIGEAHG